MNTVIERAGALAAAAGLACMGLAACAAQDAHPDFTGVWTTYRAPGEDAFGGGTFFVGDRPSLTPAGQEKVDAYQALTEGTDYSPGAYCVWAGMPGSMLGSGPYPMEIIQRPEQITVIYEAHVEVRRIFIGDRAAEISPDDVFPERNGFSVGHWDGDALVVETDHLVEQVDTFYPHSEEASIVERYTLSSEDAGAGEPPKMVLTAEMTMTDPAFLAEPYVVVKKWQQVPQGRLLNYECTEPQWLDAIEMLEAGESPPLPLGAAPAEN